MQKISRAEAKRRKLTRYYTGQTCKNGHVCERYVANYMCVECQAEHMQRQSQQQEPVNRNKSTTARLHAVAIMREPYPCQQCPFYAACQDELKACRAFYDYVNDSDWSDKDRVPDAPMYLEIFADLDMEAAWSVS